MCDVIRECIGRQAYASPDPISPGPSGGPMPSLVLITRSGGCGRALPHPLPSISSSSSGVADRVRLPFSRSFVTLAERCFSPCIALLNCPSLPLLQICVLPDARSCRSSFPRLFFIISRSFVFFSWFVGGMRLFLLRAPFRGSRRGRGGASRLSSLSPMTSSLHLLLLAVQNLFSLRD